MVLLQVNIPDGLNTNLNVYKAKNGFGNKEDAVISILEEVLEIE